MYRFNDGIVLAATTLYIASRLQGYPRLLHDISAVASISVSSLGRWQRQIVTSLQLSLPKIRASSLIPRICQAMSILPPFSINSIYVCDAIESSNILESSLPQVVATTAILLTYSTSVNIDVKKLSNIIHSSTTTLLKAFHTVKPFRESFVDTSTLSHISNNESSETNYNTDNGSGSGHHNNQKNIRESENKILNNLVCDNNSEVISLTHAKRLKRLRES